MLINITKTKEGSVKVTDNGKYTKLDFVIW